MSKLKNPEQLGNGNIKTRNFEITELFKKGTKKKKRTKLCIKNNNGAKLQKPEKKLPKIWTF